MSESQLQIDTERDDFARDLLSRDQNQDRLQVDLSAAEEATKQAVQEGQEKVDQIIADNHFDSYKDQVHLTEKVWKAITNFQPFIYIGHPTALKKLKEFGFKTFEPFIDESYDDEYDKDKRFKMIQEQISRLVCDKTIEEIHEWYWSIEKTLRHNYFHFYGKWINEHRNNLLNKISIPFHLPSEQFLFKPESEHDGEFNQPIKNCDYLRHLIWCKGGQYFIYHDSNHNSGTNNQTNETRKTRYDKEFIEGREFYIIGSGNDGDYSDVLLYDIDEIYKFFEERNVEKKKIIFLTSNNDLNLGLKTFTESIKNGGVFEPINITDWNKYNKIHKLDLHNNPHLESQIAAISDDVAYNNHDIEDALRAKLITFSSLRDIKYFMEIITYLEDLYKKIEESRLTYQILRLSLKKKKLTLRKRKSL